MAGDVTLVSRRRLLAAAGAAASLPFLPSLAMSPAQARATGLTFDDIVHYPRMPWFKGVSKHLQVGDIGRAYARYQRGAKDYWENGDSSSLQTGRSHCLQFIGGALAAEPWTEVDVQYQQFGMSVLARVLREYPEVPWSPHYATHWGYRNYLNWPRPEWPKRTGA